MRAFKFDYSDITDALIAPAVTDYVFRRLLPVLCKSAVAGVVAGVLVTLFNLALEYLSEIAQYLGYEAGGGKLPLATYILVMAFAAVFMAFFIKVLPEARGSGIPRTEAFMCGKKKLDWKKMCFATVVGSCVSFLSGLPVGAEGPSVQFGGGLGAGVEEMGGNDEKARRYVANSGVAAGVASAFIAPVTGILFVMEEVQRKFNPLMLASACISVIYAITLRNCLGAALGMKAVFFDVVGLGVIPVEMWWLILPMGIFAAVAARIFNASILCMDKLSSRSKLPVWSFIPVLFLVVMIVNIFLPQNIGSGATIISSIFDGEYSWRSVLLLLAVKFVLVVLVFRAAPTGGMMVPMLAIGAMIGALVGFIGTEAGLPEIAVPMAALITMSAFFGSCIGAPITVVALFAETTGIVDSYVLLPVVLTVLVAQIVSKLLFQKPLYDTLWERDVHREAAKAAVKTAVEAK